MKDLEAPVTTTVVASNDGDTSSDEKRSDSGRDETQTADATLIRDWSEEEENKLRRK